MRWFTSQNYAAVSLMRRGFGASTGPALEDNGPCVAPDYLRSAVLGGEDIRAVLREVSAQPWAKRTGAVVVGQSTGGWAGLGVAALNDPRIRAVIAFAPGRGAKAYAPPDSVCRPDLLVSAARELGAQKTTPVLWILALNDSYFPPEISEALHQAFIEGGGRAELVEINPFFDEGHALYNAPGGSDVWGPVVQDFLSRSP
jgi:dienelactone hydrolase